jgi:PKD repeat protein
LLGASVDSICPGTAVSLNLTGHNGNIQWLTSPDGITWGLDPNLSGNTIVATPTQTTYFQAQVSNGCGASLSNSVSVVVVPAPVAAFNWTHQPPFTVLFSDQSTGGPLAYLWDFGDGNLSTLPNPSHTYTGLGFYNVLLTVTNEYGCTDTSLQQVVIQTTGLQDVPRSTVFVWPTIACEQVQIRYSEGPYQFELVDLSGKRVFTFHTTNAEGVMTLGMQSLPSGAYLLRSSSVDQQLVLKVFKE